MTYKAIISAIKIKPFPNADRLNLGLIRGEQVVVGKDISDGQLMVYFPCDGQLSEQFCREHNLIGVWKDGRKIDGGYFTESRRIKAQKFRGQRSDGFAVPLSYLSFTGIDLQTLHEGFEFDVLNGIEICRKYLTPATIRQQSLAASNKSNPMFPKHFDTDQWFSGKDKVQSQIDYYKNQVLIILTEKCHGTSQRIGRVLVELPLTRLQRWWNDHLPVKFVSQKWEVIHGTRNAVIDIASPEVFYGSNFRKIAAEQLSSKLHKGEVIYFEVVGWINETTPIMPFHQTKELANNEFTRRYGVTMKYLYGCQPGKCKILVYRITQANEDGETVELSWMQVVKRCQELNVATVPVIATTLENTGLEALINSACNDHSLLDSTHIREGVCIRVESPEGMEIYKHKSFAFKVMEGLIKDVDVADIEESS
jgi:hypothetical protein